MHRTFCAMQKADWQDREAKPPSLGSGYALPEEQPTVLQDSAVEYGNVQRPKKHITSLMATKKEILRMEICCRMAGG